MGKIRQLLSTLLVIGILSVCALAQTNLTQIRDTINNLDGTPFNGTLVVTWFGLSTPASGGISPLSTSAHIYNGALSVLLVPTTAVAGSYYQVVYYSNDGTVTWTETWAVPPSTTALTVSAVRTSSTTGTGGSTGTGGGTTGGGTTTGTQYATLPISISEITGLSSDLTAINTSLTTLQTTVNGLGSGGGGNLTSLTNTVNALSTSVSSNTSDIAAITTTVNNLSTSSVGTNSAVTTLNTTVANLTNSLSSLSATVSSIQSGGTPITINMAFIDGETPSGVTNGSNTTFTLSQGPMPAAGLELYRNGLVQTSGVDYTLSGATINFLSGNIPSAGDVLQAYYRTNGSSTLPTFVDDEVPAGTVDGSNLTFTLSAAPNPILSLRIYKNGMLMQQHGDYSISGTTVTFVSASAPRTGDALAAYYRH